MSDGNSVELEVLIQIREELAGLTRTTTGLKEAKKEAASLGSLLKQGLGIGSGMQLAAGAVGLLKNTLSASVGEAFRMAEAVKDQSTALGITTEAYQVLRFELAQAGVDAGRLTMAMSRQTESLAESRNITSAAAKAYKDLGLNAAEVEAMRPEERLIAVARAQANATDQTKAFSAAGQILGSRGLPQLLSSLRNLADNGYGNVAAAAKNAGRVMSEETIEMLDKAKKQIDNFKATTLPIATGTAIGWLQGMMDRIGAGVGNIVNDFQGLPQGDVGNLRTPPPPPAAPTGPSRADQESVLATQLGVAEAKASAISSASLFTEAQRRKALLPVIDEQIEAMQKLIAVKYGDRGTTLPADGNVTEEELALYRERNELEAKLTTLRQQRMEAVDTPLAALNRDLLDTTGMINTTLTGGLASGVSSLSADVWSAAKGTASFGDAWRNVKNIAGQALTDIAVKLLIIRPLLSMFGLGSVSGGGVSVGAPTVALAGGGSFVTNGETNLKVGDNPGGKELVNVIPLSGVGRSTVNGRSVAMAGGGSLLAGGGGGEGVVVHQVNHFGGGVSRSEVMGMLPGIVEASKKGVLEAQARRRDGFRR